MTTYLTLRTSESLASRWMLHNRVKEVGRGVLTAPRTDVGTKIFTKTADSWLYVSSPAQPEPNKTRIPKGFRLKAQGCEERATLGRALPRGSRRLMEIPASGHCVRTKNLRENDRLLAICIHRAASCLPTQNRRGEDTAPYL